jgi:uncharacterized membrane protein
VRGRSSIEAAIIVAGLAAAVAAGAAAWRTSGPHGDRGDVDPRVRKVYDPATGRLASIAFDSDGDMKLDTWSFMDGGRATRLDIDDDQDGRIDRRQYLALDETIERTEFLDADGAVIRSEPSR